MTPKEQGFTPITPLSLSDPLFRQGDPLDELSGAQRRDVRAMEAQSYYDGDGYTLSLDYSGEVI